VSDREDIIQRIQATLKEACEDNCECCQLTTTQRLNNLGWVWLEVSGKNAIARFGFEITNTRLEIFSRPGILSNCMSSKKELEAPEVKS
jgi:hypothetical protein